MEKGLKIRKICRRSLTYAVLFQRESPIPGRGPSLYGPRNTGDSHSSHGSDDGRGETFLGLRIPQECHQKKLLEVLFSVLSPKRHARPSSQIKKRI